MLRDMESWTMSNNPNDYITYGRILAGWGAYTRASFGAGQNNDRAIFINNNQGISIVRRAIPGGPFGQLYYQLRIMLPVVRQVFSLSAMDLVNGVTHVSVNFRGDIGAISVSNAGGTLLQTNPGQFPINGRFHVGVMFLIGGGTSGAVSVWIQGVQKINLSGINTLNGSRAVMDTTFISQPGKYEGTCSYQHEIWNDATGSANNGFLGDQRVFGALPILAGDTTSFTPIGQAANWHNASIIPPGGDSDYNYSGTVGALDLYKVNTPTGAVAVKGAMVSALARKDNSGLRNLATVLKSGGTLVSGSSVALADSYVTQTDIFETDPSTGVAFVPAALSSLQIGATVSA